MMSRFNKHKLAKEAGRRDVKNRVKPAVKDASAIGINQNDTAQNLLELNESKNRELGTDASLILIARAE